MATPIFTELEKRFETVTYLAAGAVDQVLWVPERRREVIKATRSQKPRDVWNEAQMLKSRGFDAAILVNHSCRSAITTAVAGIPVRVGHNTEHRRALLTHPVAYGQSEFETESAYDLIRALEIECESRVPYLPVTDAERASGKAMLGNATVGLQPGARFGAKQLSPETCVEVANSLIDEGHVIAFLGGPEEAQFAEPMAAQLKLPPVNLVGKTSIRETMGALANLKLMIGSDTGLMHMAAGVGCPSITVFGPTPLAKWGHQYSPHTALQAPGGVMANMPAADIINAALKTLRQ